MNTQSIIQVDPNLIDPNPYQLPTRKDFAPPQLADLESVKTVGLIQVPIARPHPAEPGRYQMNVGWRRRAAWMLYRPGAPMPLDVRELTDEQMFEQSAIENGQRADLTTIEKAHLCQSAIRDFHKTQLEAGKLVGLSSQSAVSNLLRMLELPDEIQDLQSQGQLAERHARQLISLARIKPNKAIEIARKVAASGDPDDALADGIDEFLDKTGGDLDESNIPLEWVPDSPVAVEGEGQYETLPSCARCQNYLRYGYHSYCARPACLKAKRQAWIQLELARVSDKTGVPVAQPGEKAKALKLQYDTAHLAKDLLRKTIKPDCLRLIANDGSSSGDYYHRDVTGSDVVLLASTDPNILAKEKHDLDKAKSPKEKGAAQPAQSEKKSETAEQKRKRLEREKVEEAAREARREAASRQRKVMHDMAWLVFNTADRLAPQMTISPAGLLEEVLSIHHGHTHPPMTSWPQYSEPYKALDDAAEKANGKDKHLLSCKLLIARELGNAMSGYRAEEQFDWPGALEHVKGLAEDWGLKLPSGWDQPPIHKTLCNCHVCGKFTSQDHITRVDEAAGWMVDTSLVPEGFVTCSPKCRNDEAVSRLSGFSARATKAAGKKRKPLGSPRGKSTAKRGKS